MLSVKPLLFSKKHRNICPTPVAVIDIGTNTIRLLVGCVKEEKAVRIATQRAVTRLGKDLQKTGRLSQDSIEESKRFILKLKELCENYSVQKIIAIGTSALREAKNSEEFLADIKRDIGIDIEIISGEKEAELTLKGILPSLNHSIAPFSHFLLVDIGGGSTEWIFYGPEVRSQKSEARHEFMMDSIHIGAVKLFEKFIRHDPPLQDELKEMKEYIFKEFSNSLNLSLINRNSSLSLIATGGTATTIAAIDMEMDEYDGDRIHLHKVSFPTLKIIYEKLIALPHNERSKLKGLETERADIIIPGTLILLTLMEILHIDKVTVSDYGLLEGALISYNPNYEKGI